LHKNIARTRMNTHYYIVISKSQVFKSRGVRYARRFLGVLVGIGKRRFVVASNDRCFQRLTVDFLDVLCAYLKDDGVATRESNRCIMECLKRKVTVAYDKTPMRKVLQDLLREVLNAIMDEDSIYYYYWRGETLLVSEVDDNCLVISPILVDVTEHAKPPIICDPFGGKTEELQRTVRDTFFGEDLTVLDDQFAKKIYQMQQDGLFDIVSAIRIGEKVVLILRNKRDSIFNIERLSVDKAIDM